MAEARRSSEVRQVELTDAALHIIATEGISALTTRRLAEEVGLSTGAIFRHFPTLDALLDAVVARVESVLDATYPPEGLSARERLERFVDARSTAVGNQVGILRLVLSQQFLLALPESSSARLTACVEKTREFVSSCVREGQRTGELRDDIDASALGMIVMGTVQVLAISTDGTRRSVTQARRIRGGLFALLEPSKPNRSPRKRKPS